jgi:hypothetical protein
VQLLVEMATRNTTWGPHRLRGALKNVGYVVGRNTIKRILKEQGIEPAPLRRRQYSWATFIKAHLSAITAADFFTVEVLSWAGLVRYHIFFVIDLANRRVEIAGISRRPDGVWMEQVARNLLDARDGFLLGKRYLILNSRVYSGSRECLDRIVPLGETHLRLSISDYMRHYHVEPNHQGLENTLIEAAPSLANTNGRIERRERLGGSIRFRHTTGLTVAGWKGD